MRVLPYASSKLCEFILSSILQSAARVEGGEDQFCDLQINISTARSKSRPTGHLDIRHSPIKGHTLTRTTLTYLTLHTVHAFTIRKGVKLSFLGDCPKLLNPLTHLRGFKTAKVKIIVFPFHDKLMCLERLNVLTPPTHSLVWCL